MTNYKSEFVSQEQKTSIIRITSYENKNFVGTLQNSFYSEKKSFTNLTQLLFLIENLQDELNYPRKCMETRSFKSDKTTLLEIQEPEELPKTALATFNVSLLFRQNASWQGTVVWVEEAVGAQFRSALELVSLMDSVLD